MAWTTQTLAHLPEAFQMARDTTLSFPANIEIYHYISAACPDSAHYFQQRARVNGVELTEAPSSFFTNAMGFTGLDQLYLIDAVRQGTTAALYK